MKLPAQGSQKRWEPARPIGRPPSRRAILDSLPAQIAVIDHNGVITYVSEAAI